MEVKLFISARVECEYSTLYHEEVDEDVFGSRSVPLWVDSLALSHNPVDHVKFRNSFIFLSAVERDRVLPSFPQLCALSMKR